MSGYTKLFSSILNSTVWVGQKPATKLVWITMLASADRDGVVTASVAGLAKLAEVKRAECEEALKLFLAPDPDSSSKEYDGRRIEQVDRGWRLLNHMKYRELEGREDQLARHRERQKRYRDRLVASGGRDATGDAGDVTRDGRDVTVTQMTQADQSHKHKQRQSDQSAPTEGSGTADHPVEPIRHVVAPLSPKIPARPKPVEATRPKSSGTAKPETKAPGDQPAGHAAAIPAANVAAGRRGEPEDPRIAAIGAAYRKQFGKALPWKPDQIATVRAAVAKYDPALIGEIAAMFFGADGNRDGDTGWREYGWTANQFTGQGLRDLLPDAQLAVARAKRIRDDEERSEASIRMMQEAERTATMRDGTPLALAVNPAAATPLDPVRLLATANRTIATLDAGGFDCEASLRELVGAAGKRPAVERRLHAVPAMNGAARRGTA